MSEALSLLAPYPVDQQTFDPEKQSKDEMWNKFNNAFKNKYIWVCSSTDKKGNLEDEWVELGVVPDHAYSVSGLYHFEHSNKRIKLLKIRNPWNKKEQEWKGDWSDSDAKWNSSLKSKVKFDTKQNGEFYIEFDHFLKYFPNYAIWQADPSFDKDSIELSHK